MTNEEKKRTIQQNRALHLWFTLLADELNNSGLDMKIVLKPEADIPWTLENVKNHIWRPVQEAMIGKQSTTELSTTEIDKILDVITRHLGEKFGVQVDFPSIATLIEK